MVSRGYFSGCLLGGDGFMGFPSVFSDGSGFRVEGPQSNGGSASRGPDYALQILAGSGFALRSLSGSAREPPSCHFKDMNNDVDGVEAAADAADGDGAGDGDDDNDGDDDVLQPSGSPPPPRPPARAAGSP